MARRIVAAGALALLASGPAAAQAISTVAGNGQATRNVDAGPAAAFHLGQPFGVEFGPDRMLYVTEVQNHRIVRVNLATGHAATIAGNGVRGYAGDGGPALAASLNEPYEVRFDDRTMYFVEMQNHLIRAVDLDTGLIRTLAGDGSAGFAGDGGPARNARFRRPHSIALDGRGGLLVADIGNHRIRRIDLRQETIETIAGTGDAQPPVAGQAVTGRPVLGPRALFVRDQQVWVALREGHSVWKFHLDHLRWEHVAGSGRKGFRGDGGDARLAEFNGPKGVALDSVGRVVVVDTENQVLRRIDPQSGLIETIAGRGPAFRGDQGDGGPATQAWLNRPHGVCVGPDDAVYLGDTENHRVRRIEPR